MGHYAASDLYALAHAFHAEVGIIEGEEGATQRDGLVARSIEEFEAQLHKGRALFGRPRRLQVDGTKRAAGAGLDSIPVGEVAPVFGEIAYLQVDCRAVFSGADAAVPDVVWCRQSLEVTLSTLPAEITAQQRGIVEVDQLHLSGLKLTECARAEWQRRCRSWRCG